MKTLLDSITETELGDMAEETVLHFFPNTCPYCERQIDFDNHHDTVQIKAYFQSLLVKLWCEKNLTKEKVYAKI